MLPRNLEVGVPGLQQPALPQQPILPETQPGDDAAAPPEEGSE